MRTAIATAIAFAATALNIAPAHADETTRVMVLGDSVTQGKDGDHTWRYYAWQTLDGAGIDFIGPNRGTVGVDYFDGTYADNDFDQDHAARWGLSMWETLYWNSDTAPGVASLMASEPDVIVETLGVNDLLHMNQSPEQTIGHLEKIVGQARAINPDVDFVLGSLPQVWFESVADYNALLPTAAEALSTPESQVVVTPTAVLELGLDTYDATHPTNTGDQKIADAMTAGLAELGIEAPEPQPEPEPTPEPAPVEPQPVTPAVVEAIAPPATLEIPAPPAPVADLTAPRGVKAKRIGKTVRVKWRAVEGADTYSVRCGKTVTTSRTAAKVKTKATKCTVRAINDAGRGPVSVVRFP